MLNLKLALPALLLLVACTDPEQQQTGRPELPRTARPAGAEPVLPDSTLAQPDSLELAELDEAMQAEQDARRWISLRPYLVLAELDPDQLSLKVSARLRQGYRLRGPLNMQRQTGPGRTSRQQIVYIQNMILLDSLWVKKPEGSRLRVEE